MALKSVRNILNPVSYHNASWFIYKQQHFSEPYNSTLIYSWYIWRVTKMYCQDRDRNLASYLRRIKVCQGLEVYTDTLP